MAGGRRGTGSGRPPNVRRRRVPPTIDLMATEIPPEEMPAEPAPEPEPEPAAPTWAEAQSPESEPEPSAEPPQADPIDAPPQPEPPAQSRQPSDEWRALIGGGAAGAGAALLLVALLWLAGAFAPRDDRSASLAALADRIAALDKQVGELAARPTPNADPKAIGELSTRLNAIEPNLRRIDDMAGRVSRIESALAAPRPAATDPALLERIAALEAATRAVPGAITELRQRLDDASAAARDAKGRADLAAEKADKATAPRPGAVERSDLDALGARIAALEQAEKAIDNRIGQTKAGAVADGAVRLALAASTLRDAIERGGPFATELAAAKALGADTAKLEPFAAAGVPSPAALAHELSQFAPEILRSAAAPAGEGGVLSRLQANAEQLVRIRPIGEAPGDGPRAIVARADANAAHGDIAGAMAELDRLPDAMKAPAAAWMRRAAARETAVAAARQLAAQTLAALGKPSP